jgi:hypothetical protein
VRCGRPEIEKTARPAEKKPCGPLSFGLFGPAATQQESAQVWLERFYLNGLRTLGALLDDKLDALVLLQRTEPIALDGRVMDEYVLSDLAGDKAIAFSVVEPFDGTSFFFGHFPYSLICLNFCEAAWQNRKKDRPISASWGSLWISARTYFITLLFYHTLAKTQGFAWLFLKMDKLTNNTYKE